MARQRRSGVAWRSMADDPLNTKGTAGRISLPAALGALALVAGSILFGVLGPRMGQRGIRLSGTPLSEVRDVAIDIYGGWFLGRIEDLESSMEAYPGIPELGFEPRGSEATGNGPDGGATAHWFARPGDDVPVLVFQLENPSRFVYFDSLGRQRPLLPGDRIEESIDLEAVDWVRELARSRRRDLDPRRLFVEAALGVVVLGLGEEAVVVIAAGLEEAVEVADRIAPAIEAEDGGEVAFRGYP